MRTDVLIVGGGPTGMVAALCLARAGVDCMIVERRPGLSPHPKAHEINARTMEILDGLGIASDELAALASGTEEAGRVLFCRSLGEELGRLELPDEGYARHVRSRTPYLNLSQVALERVLRDRVEASPRVTLCTGVSWDGFAQGSRSASRLSVGGETVMVHHRFLIGADGANSRVRRALGVEMEGPDQVQDFVSAAFALDLSDAIPARAKLYWLLHPEAPGTLIAHHIERSWVYQIPLLGHERIEDWTPARLADRLSVAVGREIPESAVTSVSLWRMSAQVASRFRVENTWLAGDAAHRFPPTGGLGLNTGVADAHNLAWKLVAVLRGEATDALLDTYEAERRPVARVNCAESLSNFERMFDVLGVFGVPRDALDKQSHLLAWTPSPLRPLVLSVLSWWLHRQLDAVTGSARGRARLRGVIAEQMPHFDRLGLDIGYVYGDGALVPDGVAPEPHDRVRGYLPSSTPGARLPHRWLDEAHSCSTLDVVDPVRPTLLTATPSAWQHVRVPVVEVPADALPGLPRRGALLVRPDGHIAWRARQPPDCPPAAVEEALCACHLC